MPTTPWRTLPLLISLSLSLFSSAAPQAPFENTAIVRTIELSGALVHVTTTYAIKALQPAVKHYTIALGDEELERASMLEARIKGTGAVSQKPLEIELGKLEHGQLYHLVDIDLPTPLAVNATLNLVVETVETHATKPWPQTASQKQEQALKYGTQLFVLSPYHTAVQRTKIKAPSPRIITYTTPREGPSLAPFTSENVVAKSGATITYGPFTNIPASATNEFVEDVQQRVSVHYNYDHPVLEVDLLKRAVEVSHWGANLNVQDEISLRNAGPTLKGHFSRLEYQSQNFYKQASPHIIPSLTLFLPAGISNTYYYDLIGNVSTSNLRVAPPASQQKSVLELKPRYPLLGGWNYSFTLGWDAPLGDSEKWDAKNGKFVLEVPVMTVLSGAVVNNAELKVVLPEGATNVDFVAPFPAISNWLGREHTYLDTTGRPTLTFYYKDLTPKHDQSIYITYKVPLSAHMRKPAVVAAAFFAFFALAFVARRVDLTILPQVDAQQGKKKKQ